MHKPLLIAFLGFPGSGKTYFASKLAREINAVTFNSDAMRVAIFGSLQAIEDIRTSNPSRLYKDVFGAMDYGARQALQAGHSVIYDAQQTKRENRQNIETIAAESGAIPILVWVKTSRQVALERGQQRQARDDSHVYDADKMAYLIDRFEGVTDLPIGDENVIEISGELDFTKQYESFNRQLVKFTN